VRDAAYSSLLKARRAQLHAAIASTLEQRFPEIVDGAVEMVDEMLALQREVLPPIH
jgi:hypothetical protein